MPNLEELIKIRKQAIEKYMQENNLEQFLLKSAQVYYDKYIIKSLESQATEDLKKDKISYRHSGKYVTTNNEKISKLFLDKISALNIKFFSHEDIDNISPKDDPIIYVIKSDNHQEYEYFIRISYLKGLAKQDGFNFAVETETSMDGLFVSFEVMGQVPKLVFARKRTKNKSVR